MVTINALTIIYHLMSNRYKHDAFFTECLQTKSYQKYTTLFPENGGKIQKSHTCTQKHNNQSSVQQNLTKHLHHAVQKVISTLLVIYIRKITIDNVSSLNITQI